MTELEGNKDVSRYYKKISPLEIGVNKEEIFYRDKYNEIMNYIKALFSNSLDSETFTFLNPKGTLIINIESGSDILDFIKVIAKNYYLEICQLNLAEVIKSPENICRLFYNLVENIVEESVIQDKVEKTELNIEKNVVKRIILIDQKEIFRKSFENTKLLAKFIGFCQDFTQRINFLERNLMLIWINYNYSEIIELSSEIYNSFDLLIKIPTLSDVERETILKNYMEKNPKISFDVNAITNYTENWEVKDIEKLLKVAIFKYILNSDLNNISNEITDVIINLIESGEFLPSIISRFSEKQELEEQMQYSQANTRFSPKTEDVLTKSLEGEESIVERIKEESVSEFMLNQLYENAASKNYSEIVVIIDKLKKNEPLEANARKILAKYPFILNDPPNQAEIYLEKAKKRVDLMKKAFRT